MKKIFLLLTGIFIINSIMIATPADTTKNDLYGWSLIKGYLIEPLVFDTTIAEFQILNFTEKSSISNLWLGTIGTPWKSNIYSVRADSPHSDFFFDQNYHINLLTAENQPFFHAKKPYFDIDWTTAPKKIEENQLNALFTQSINAKWNVGLRYRLISSGGEYPNAHCSQHSWNIFASYTGEKYSMHTAFVRNKIKAEENGGIKNDTLNDPQFAEAYLESDSSKFYKRSFFISQQYKFGFTQKIVVDDTTTISNFKEAGRLNYIIRFDRNYRTYTGEGASDYYKNVLIDSTRTRDSLHLSRMENSFYWSFKEINRENFNGRFTVGSTFDYFKWSTLNETDIDTIYKTKAYSTINLFGNLSAKTKNFVFMVDALYYLKGTDNYKQYNYEVNLLISKSINIFKYRTSFYAKLNNSLSSPDLYLQSYFSNHFKWDNDFSKIFSTNTRFGIEIPKIKLGAEVLLGTVQNYIYFDTTALPKQVSNPLNILSISVNKTFKLWHFSSVNKAVYQLSSENSELCLPEWSIYHSFFFDKFFKQNRFSENLDIHLQIGYDLNFTSWYHANSYMPATGVFYQSKDFLTGNYAIINAFVNLRIKTVLIFAKMEHVNNLMLLDKYYYVMDKYRAGSGVFKFGVSWRFRD